ncbi:MAG: hypothetical protein WCC64_18935 [Aliidongia sp.]
MPAPRTRPTSEAVARIDDLAGFLDFSLRRLYNPTSLLGAIPVSGKPCLEQRLTSGAGLG